METKDGQAKPPGICHRLYNFVMKSLTCMRLPLTSNGSSATGDGRRVKEVAVGSQVEVAVNSVEGESMIPVEHRETWDRVGLVEVDFGPKHGVLKTVRDQLDATKKKAAKKTVSIKGEDDASKKVASMKEEKRNAGSKVLRPSKPVLMVVPNINEKSDAFIQNKKEKLRRGV